MNNKLEVAKILLKNGRVLGGAVAVRGSSF